MAICEQSPYDQNNANVMYLWEPRDLFHLHIGISLSARDGENMT